MIKNFNDLLTKVKDQKAPKKVVVVSAHDEHTLSAIGVAYRDGIAEPILIGDSEKIKQMIEVGGFPISDTVIYDEKDDTAAAKKAVSMIREGAADFLMKGKLQTADLLREVVNKEYGLNKGRVMSHFSIFEIAGYHKLLVLTDGGMVPYPDIEEKSQLIMNAVDVLHSLGYEEPKVAALVAAELVNPKMPESVDADTLKKMNKEGKIKGCIVEGPISYDLAMSREAAKIKAYESPVTGDADILLMPDMVSGNILAKAFQFTAGAKMAGIVVGAKVPIVLVSRSATAEEKYLSLALSAASA